MRPIHTPGERPEAWWRAGILSVTFAGAAKQFAPSVADPDLWGHLLFGQLAAATGWIPRFDPYSYLSIEWVNHEWLAEHFFAGAFGAAGTTGLILLKLSAALAIAGLLIWNLWDRGLELLRAAVLGLLLSLPLVMGLQTIRPHLFTYLFFTVTLLVLARAEDTDGRGLLLLLPLFVAWTNLHGGVLAGLGVVGIWTGVRTVRWAASRVGWGEAPKRPSPWVWIAAAGGVTAATLVSPYGLELLEFLLTTATVPRTDITEWRPLPLRSGFGMVWLAGSALTTWALLRADRRPGPEALAVLIVAILLPLTAVRHFPLTFIAVAALGADSFASLWGTGAAAGDRENRTATRSPRSGWIGAGLTVLAAVVLLRIGEDLECIRMGPELGISYPVRATAWLQESGVRADMATYFTYGEYLIWHLSPRIRVGMDGRRETVYPDSIYRAYLDFQHGTDDWDRFLAFGDPQLALFPTGMPADNLLGLHPRWTVVLEDSVARVHALRGSAAEAALRDTPVPELPPSGEGLCFP